MSLLVRIFELLVDVSLCVMALSALVMISSYGAVVLSKIAGLNTSLFAWRTSQWSVRLAWVGAIAFAVGFLVFLIVAVGDYLINGDRLG